MSDTCTIEILENEGLVRHGLSVELMLMGTRDLTIFEREYDLFKHLEDTYPDNSYFLKPAKCTMEGAFYKMYNPRTLYQARSDLLQQGPNKVTVNETTNDNPVVENQQEDTLMEAIPEENSINFSVRNYLPPHQRLWGYVIEVAEAMRYLHQAGIIHRNLSVYTVSAGKNIILSDLISAARYNDDTSNPEIPPMFSGVIYSDKSSYRVINNSSMSPIWTAPEAYKDPTKFSPASDMYSFGILAHHLVSGYTPNGIFFDPVQLNDHIEQFNKQLEESNSPLDPAVNLTHIQEFMSLLQDCLSPDPSLRPSFNDEFMQRLERIRILIEEQSIDQWLKKKSENSSSSKFDLSQYCKLL